MFAIISSQSETMAVIYTCWGRSLTLTTAEQQEKKKRYVSFTIRDENGGPPVRKSGRVHGDTPNSKIQLQKMNKRL
jgi:hypothetical protein